MKAKRTAFQRERDLAMVSQMYLRGFEQQEIVKELAKDPERGYTLTQQTISKDLALIKKRWIEYQVQNMSEAKARELAKIDQLEREYWRAWERSVKELKKSRTGRRLSGPAAAAPDQPAKAQKESRQADTLDVWKEERYGDPRFLAGVQWCINRRIEIQGLDAPKKMEWQDVTKRLPWKEMTNDQLRRITNNEPLERVIPGWSPN